MPQDVAPKFAPAPMSDLTDLSARYDLAESTCPPVRLGEILTPDVVGRLQDLHVGYGTSQGDGDLRALIGAEVGVGADDVLVTVGGIAGMFLLAFTLCEAGDDAVVVTPCFPPALAVLEALRARVSTVPLAFADGYRLDVDAVAAALTPRTKLVSLASPQNPSGVRFTDDEVRALVTRVDAVAPRAVVLLDETYRQATYGDAPVPPSLASLTPRVVTCSSLSKSHGTPGIRIGWLTATDAALYEALRRAKFNSLITTSGVDDLLAAEVLRHQDRLLAPRHAALRAALDILEHWAAAHTDEVAYLRPDGGALCTLRLRESRFDEQATHRFYAALADRDTRVAPGSWFGESDRVFRLGFGHLPPSVFTEALDRLGQSLKAA